MFSAVTARQLGASSLHTAIYLERRFRAHLVRRHNLLLDSQYMAPSAGASPIANLFLVLAGHSYVHGHGWVAAPHALCLDANEFERVDRDAVRFCSWGTPCVLIDLRVHRDDLGLPIGLRHGPVPLATPVVELIAEATAEFCRAPSRIAPSIDFPRLLSQLTDAGWLRGSWHGAIAAVEPESFHRLWNGLRPLLENSAVMSSMSDIQAATGLSLRQLSRDVKEFTQTFGLPGEGLRDVARVLRLRAAVVFLSTPGATASEVARQVGYASLDAMGRAFRDAKLPAPSVIQDHARSVALPR